jgi:hypothetical protein
VQKYLNKVEFALQYPELDFKTQVTVRVRWNDFTKGLQGSFEQLKQELQLDDEDDKHRIKKLIWCA